MSFTTIDPVTGTLQEKFEYLSESQITESIDKLNKSFLKWKNLKIDFRQKILAVLAARLNQKKEFYAQLITQEMGKPISDSMAEVLKCIKTLERSAELNLNFLEAYSVDSENGKSLVLNEPLGVIYSMMPWNFPLWQVIRMSIPALISGNTLLLKHSEIVPKLAQEIQKLFGDLFEYPILINANISHELTDFVVSNPKVGGVSLTGSVQAGREVYKLTAKYFKKAVLELGGSDPYLVFADADLQLAANKIAKSRLLNNGQTCISAKRCLVDKNVLNVFIDFLVAEFNNYKIGDPKKIDTDLGPLAHPRFKVKLAEQILSLKHNTDAKLIYSKKHNQSENSAFVDIEIYLLSKNHKWLNDQEFFAPILIIIPFDNGTEAVEIANSSDFALGAAVFSKDVLRATGVCNKISAGQIAINDFIKTDISIPFGGFKCSGVGRELGRESFFEFTQTKVITTC